MSYDCCRLCGELGPAPYVAMSKACDREGCPGAKRQAFMAEVMAKMPVRRMPSMGETAEVQGHWRNPYDAQPGCHVCGRAVGQPCLESEGCRNPGPPQFIPEGPHA